MSKVVFTDINIQNFSIIKSLHVPLNTKGITIIDGAIGTGKSSILEAFYFCLTGEFFEHANTFKSALNRFNKEQMVLILNGYTDVPFKIIRTMTTKSAKSSEVKHTLQFFINNEPIHEKVNSTAQIQERILEYLDIDPLLLFNSKIFGQGDISSFTKVNDRKKKIIIDKLVGIGFCDKAHKISVTMLSETNTLLTSLNIEISALELRLNELNIETAELIAKQTEWNTPKVVQQDKNLEQIKLITTDINKLKSQIAECKNTQDELLKLGVDTAEITSIIAKLRLCLPSITQQIEIHNNARISLDREKNYTIGQLSLLQKDIKRLETFKVSGESTKCPTCYSTIDLDAIKNAIADLTTSQNALQTTISLHEKGIESEESKYLLWVDKKTQVDTAIGKHTTKLNMINSIINKIDDATTKIRNYESTIAAKQEILKVLNSSKVEQPSICPYDEIITAKEIEINTKQQLLQSKQLEYSILEDRRKYLAFFSRAFNNNGIPQLISNDALKVLNILMDNYKNKLLGNKFKLVFKTRKVRENEEIYPDVLNPIGGEGYYRQSKGERRKIDLCQMFALSDFAKMQSKCDINVMFFDEVFSELNHSESEAVLEVINEYPVTSKFIISHKDLFKEEFPNVIKMVKKGKESHASVNVIGWDGEDDDQTTAA